MEFGKADEKDIAELVQARLDWKNRNCSECIYPT